MLNPFRKKIFHFHNTLAFSINKLPFLEHKLPFLDNKFYSTNHRCPFEASVAFRTEVIKTKFEDFWSKKNLAK